MKKIIVGMALGAGLGAIIGSVFSRKKCEAEFDDSINDIYNKCYKEAREELTREQSTHKKIIKQYQKPDLFSVSAEVFDKSRTISNGEEFDERDSEESDESNESEDEEEDVLDEPCDDVEELRELAETGIISEHDFLNDCPHHRKTDIFYYSLDQTFTDEDDNIMIPSETDLFNAYRFDVIKILKSESKAYFRDCDLETDFEIHRLNHSFTEFQFETPKEREKRMTKRKLKDF